MLCRLFRLRADHICSMLSSYPVHHRGPHCSRGARYAKYRVFIDIEQVPLLDTNEFFINNFISTNYHDPIPGYREFSYVCRQCRLSKSEFISMISSMGITKYEIPIQHINNKQWYK